MDAAGMCSVTHCRAIKVQVVIISIFTAVILKTYTHDVCVTEGVSKKLRVERIIPSLFSFCS